MCVADGVNEKVIQRIDELNHRRSREISCLVAKMVGTSFYAGGAVTANTSAVRSGCYE